MSEKPFCFNCVYQEGYYRYKTASRGRNRLVVYYCTHPKHKKEWNKRKQICMARNGVYEKVTTRKKWCPLIKKVKVKA